jgi:N-acetylglucosaminyl-diphospho-decaprenol L-rhamnosyltransferase
MLDQEFSAVVVTYNSAEHILPCLASLRKACAKTVVVDNGSRDETPRLIAREFPEVQIICAAENLGYGKALNLGIAQTSSTFVLAANADTMFPDGSLQALATFLARHLRVGVAGPQQLFPDGSWQRSYGEVPGIYEGVKNLVGVTSLGQVADRLVWRYLAARSEKSVGYVDGAVMMIRRAAFDEIGGFDTDFHHYGEDADFCLRLRHHGWDVVNVPSVQVTHVRGGSSTKVEGYSDKLLFALASAERQFIRKHARPWHLRLYRQVRILHAAKMWLMYRLLWIISPGSYAPRASVMAWAFLRWARILIQLKS